MVKDEEEQYIVVEEQWVGNDRLVWVEDFSGRCFLLSTMEEIHVGFVSGNYFGEHGFGHFRTLFLKDVNTLEGVYNRLDRFIKNTLNKLLEELML